MWQDRVVIITGAAGGVGTVLVDRFIRNGDQVIAVDATSDGLERLRAQYRSDARITTVVGDVSREADGQRLAEVTASAAGRADVLINCAGFFPIVAFDKMTPSEWNRVIEINLTGTFLVTRAILPLMSGRGWGRIINFGSASTFDGTPGQAHYVAAKAGVIGFSRSLAREVGGQGITVNVITPGLTVTQAVRDHFPPAVLESQRSRRAIQRDETPEDLVGPVFFLASPDSDFMSGQTINVDGGKFMI